MKRNKKPMPSILGVGTVSVIFIFLLLALAVFAVLAFESAGADYRLSRKAADRTAFYYEASNRAQERIGEVDRLLNEIYEQSASVPEYLDEAEQALGRMPWGRKIQAGSTREGDEIALSWRESISEAEDLVVSLRITPPDEGESFYEIEQYRVEPSGEWNGDVSGSDKNE